MAEPEIPPAERAAALNELGPTGSGPERTGEPGPRPGWCWWAAYLGPESTLARGLAEKAGFTVIRSDLVRKELAGLGTNRGEVAALRRASTPLSGTSEPTRSVSAGRRSAVRRR